MAEFVLKDLVKKRGVSDKFYIESAATSTEEIGNAVHRGTVNRLAKEGISCAGKRARQMTALDFEKFDYIVAMDNYNIENIYRFLARNVSIYTDEIVSKVRLLLSFCGENREVADPWYTGNFDVTYDDVLRGCKALLDSLIDE